MHHLELTTRSHSFDDDIRSDGAWRPKIDLPTRAVERYFRLDPVAGLGIDKFRSVVLDPVVKVCVCIGTEALSRRVRDAFRLGATESMLPGRISLVLQLRLNIVLDLMT